MSRRMGFEFGSLLIDGAIQCAQLIIILLTCIILNLIKWRTLALSKTKHINEFNDRFTIDSPIHHYNDEEDAVQFDSIHLRIVSISRY